ncbi:hypothetical protein C8J56DRAFT_885304 [Mycena floridula]|nr:hypothetical protein C8J56DRAFT_885304 [Mycena floridula]
MIFQALKIGRQYHIGEGAEYKAGLLICMGNAADGFGEQTSTSLKNLGLQKLDHIIQPNHQLYAELHECLVQLRHELQLDSHLGPNLDTTGYPSMKDYSRWFQKRPWDLLTPGICLRIAESFLHKEVPDLIQQEQELAFGPVVTTPVGQSEAHFRQPMWANQNGLKHHMQNLCLADQEAFITLVTVQVHLHGIDTVQMYSEQLNVMTPFSHLDQPQVSNPIIHVTAINCGQTHTLIINDPDDFDRQLRNAVWVPDPYKAHLADLMPLSIMICIWTLSTHRNAMVTLNREWEKLPKICQDTVST